MPVPEDSPVAARRGEMADAARRQERLMQTSQLSSVVAGAAPTGSPIAAMKAIAATTPEGVSRGGGTSDPRDS